MYQYCKIFGCYWVNICCFKMKWLLYITGVPACKLAPIFLLNIILSMRASAIYVYVTDVRFSTNGKRNRQDILPDQYSIFILFPVCTIHQIPVVTDLIRLLRFLGANLLSSSKMKLLLCTSFTTSHFCLPFSLYTALWLFVIMYYVRVYCLIEVQC